MKEELESKESPTGEKPGAEQAADASATEARGRTPLGDWRGPAFWMACGVLLAGLVVGAVIVVQRVGVERDMMAVSTTLPAEALAGAGGAAGTSAGATRLAQDSAPGTVPETGTTPPGAAGGVAAPAESGLRSKPAAGDERRGAAAREGNTPGLRRPPARESIASVKTSRPGQRLVSVATAKRGDSTRRVRRKPGAFNENKYAEVFKRCPPPGSSGSVECRRHICNGAESEGPACRPYRGRLK